MTSAENYEFFKKQIARVTDLGFADAVLGWDQQTYMPKQGASFRSQQMSTLRTMAHEEFVSAKFGDVLEKLSQDATLTEDQRKNVALVKKDYLKRKKLPHEFVEDFSRACGDAYTAWAEAKTKNQFSIFEPHLSKLVEFKKREAEYVGYDAHPYEALLDDYEPGLTVAKIDSVFADVKTQLFPFIKKIAEKKKPESSLLTQHFPKEQQLVFTRKLVEQMGFDFERGRADFTMHPFCTTFGPGDVRITLWSDENFLNAMVFAGIHEAGHGLYELGLPLESEYGLPLGQAISLAFHESQSRFWENNIARSLPYWKGNFKLLQEHFPEQFKTTSVEQYYSAINEVQPSFVRVEADELTYHAHIYIRYLIEKSLVEGSLNAKDIPAMWNEKYQEYLGITPKSDTEGCLQDVHWSYGSFGYFPTYSLGSFYAAQMAAQMKKENPTFDQEIEKGNLKLPLDWLRKNIHAHGRKYNSEEILTRTTGSGLQLSYFMDYVKKKYGALYGIE